MNSASASGVEDPHPLGPPLRLCFCRCSFEFVSTTRKTGEGDALLTITFVEQGTSSPDLRVVLSAIILEPQQHIWRGGRGVRIFAQAVLGTGAARWF